MYLRTKLVKTSKTVQLIKPFRDIERMPRQRVIASLGDAQISEDEKKQIARAVGMRIKKKTLCLKRNFQKNATQWVTRIVRIAEQSKASRPVTKNATVDGVLVDQVEAENVVGFGA